MRIGAVLGQRLHARDAVSPVGLLLRQGDRLPLEIRLARRPWAGASLVHRVGVGAAGLRVTDAGVGRAR